MQNQGRQHPQADGFTEQQPAFNFLHGEGERYVHGSHSRIRTTSLWVSNSEEPICDTIEKLSVRRADWPPGRCRTGEAVAWPQCFTGRLFLLGTT
jgi:hypothetical protein